MTDPHLTTVGHSVELEWESGDGHSYRAFLIYRGIEDVGRGDRIEAVGEWSGSSADLFFVERLQVTVRAGSVERMRRRLRSIASERVLDRVPGSNGSLSLGLIIGDDSGLTRSERDELRASGLTHITAVSGSNVTLVIVAVAFVMRALNRTGWIWFSILVTGIIFYVWIVGPDPPIVRAAIMGSLALIAGVIGRPVHLLTLLALAGALMALQHPATITTLSFQLSFLSMIGLAVAGDVVIRARGTRRKVAAALLSPVGAALATAPLLAARFGTLSFGAAPANILVAPLIAPATLLSGVAAVIPDGFASGAVIGFVVWVLTGLILKASALIGSSEWAVLTFRPLSNSQTVGLYLLLGVVVAPLVPEVRLAAFRLKSWGRTEPARAIAVVAATMTSIAAVGLIVD